MNSELEALTPAALADTPQQTASPTAVATLMQHAQAMQAAKQLADVLCDSELVPAIYRGKPGNGAAAILYGAELGLNPVQSLQQIFVVQGKPAIYARTMVALLKAKGYRIQTLESSDQSVTVAGASPDGLQEQSTWTIERARKAGYLSNKKYETDPQSMLYSKAAAEVCRKLAPDVLLGISHSVEDMDVPIKATSERVATRPSARDVLDNPEPEPERAITPQQLKALHAKFKDVGLTNRDEGLAWLTDVVGRDITSSKQLTAHEAGLALDELEKAGQPDETEMVDVHLPEPDQMQIGGEGT